MPIYEYKCPKCGNSLETLRRVSEPNLEHFECPECKNEMDRQISVSSFHLKGSGWYKTDYANKGNNKSNAS